MALLGFALYIILGIMKTQNKHKGKEFSYSVYLKDEILTIIASAITVVILMIGLPEIADKVFPVYLDGDLIPSAIIGFSAYTIWDKIMNITKPKKFIEK